MRTVRVETTLRDEIRSVLVGMENDELRIVWGRPVRRDSVAGWRIADHPYPMGLDDSLSWMVSYTRSLMGQSGLELVEGTG